MSKMPLVTVVLPCFNGERVVADALRSIISQTYSNLEILVLDDGSTDDTGAAVEAAGRGDSRIRLSSSSTNTGLIATLNRGISEAAGDYIARMDDDDLSDPTRIEKTIQLFASRPQLSAAGTSARYVSALTGRQIQPRPARCFEPAGARFMTLFAPPIVHPTLVARSDVLRALPYGSDPRSLHTEDYELFSRMSEAGHTMMNLREQLVTIRVRPQGVSLSNEAAQIANFVHCSLQHLSRMTGATPPEPAHRVLVNRMTSATTAGDLVAGLALLDELESKALERANDDAGRADIRRVADMQRVDILSQAILRGGRSLRAQALTQVRADFRRLLSGDARSYIATKLAVLAARRER